MGLLIKWAFYSSKYFRLGLNASQTFVSAWGSTPGSPGEVLSQAVAEGRSVFDECLAKADEEEAEAKVAMVGLMSFCFEMLKSRRRDGLIEVSRGRIDGIGRDWVGRIV